MASDAAEFALDWERSGIWVQDRSLYLVPDDTDADTASITITDQMGQSRTVDRKAFEETHEPVRDAAVYKARYAPVQAFCPPVDMRIEVSEGAFDVPAGDALVRGADGTIRILARHDFNCRYQFVAAGGKRAPFT